MKRIVTTLIIVCSTLARMPGAEEEPYRICRFLPGNRSQTAQLHPAEDTPALVPADLLPPAARRLDTGGLVDGLVDRIESAQRDASHLDPALDGWLAEHEDVRKAFWLAIDPVYDDPQRVIIAFDHIRKERPELIAKYHHLAIALAVVYDQPQALLSSRYFLIWAVDEQQWPAMPELLEIFDAYTAKKASAHLLIRPDKLVWPLLVHVVDNDLPAAERQAAIKRFTSQRKGLAGVYAQVDYDYDKLKHKPRLGSRPYTLDNLLNPAYGGVCVDQAHVCSRVMKTFGIPAMKMCGDGRYGGAGHAWTSYLSHQGKTAIADTGRYNMDNYWTGTAFDPQRQTVVSDRSMMMMLDGALSNYGDYIEARALTRMARAQRAGNPEAALALCDAALKSNVFCEEAWMLLARLYLDGAFDDKQLEKQIKRLNKVAQHPDITLAFISTVLDRYATDDIDKRMKIYGKLLPVYKQRPDLQLSLGDRMCRELFAADQAAEAVNQAARIAEANASEGQLALPLVELVVEECLKRDEKIRAKAYGFLDRMAETRFPRKRGDTVSEAYLKLRELVDSLRE